MPKLKKSLEKKSYKNLAAVEEAYVLEVARLVEKAVTQKGPDTKAIAEGGEQGASDDEVLTLADSKELPGMTPEIPETPYRDPCRDPIMRSHPEAPETPTAPHPYRSTGPGAAPREEGHAGRDQGGTQRHHL